MAAVGSVNNAVALGVHIVTGAVLIPSLPPGVTYTQVATSWNHTALLRSDGSVVAVGWNNTGQIDIPVLPAGLTYVGVTAGDSHTVLTRSDGTVIAIGWDGWGQTDVPDLPDGVVYAQTAARYYHTVLLTKVDSGPHAAVASV